MALGGAFGGGNLHVRCASVVSSQGLALPGRCPARSIPSRHIQTDAEHSSKTAVLESNAPFHAFDGPEKERAVDSSVL